MSKGLTQLNDMLFAQMERLAKDGMTAEQLDMEVRRAEAMVATADQITENAKVAVAAAKLYAEHGNAVLTHLPLIGSSGT